MPHEFMMQKMIVNQAMENMGLWFRRYAQVHSFKAAVQCRECCGTLVLSRYFASDGNHSENAGT
jgi:hypothetical protein